MPEQFVQIADDAIAAYCAAHLADATCWAITSTMTGSARSRSMGAAR